MQDRDQTTAIREYVRAENARREGSGPAVGGGVLSTLEEDLRDSKDEVAVAELGDGSAGVIRVRRDGVTVYRWVSNDFERLYLADLKGGALTQKDRLIRDIAAVAEPAVGLKIEHDRLPGGSATLDLESVVDEDTRLGIRDALLKLLS